MPATPTAGVVVAAVTAAGREVAVLRAGAAAEGDGVGELDVAHGRAHVDGHAPGAPPADWSDLFASISPDAAGALDGAADPMTLPALDDEPSEVREDITGLKAAGS